MKRAFYKSPYLWAALAVAAVVTVAWVGRENYQPVITGTSAPDFVATDMAGDPVRLSDYRGRVVLVNVWATWCAPCRNEMPSMQRLYDALGDTDFEILAVSIDARAGERSVGGQVGGNLQAFADELGLTFPILHDPDGKIERIYQTTGVPETFLVGRDGLIYKKVAGGTDWDAPVNQELVRRLLGE
ncbi:MAG TPA: TlpA disulfide reductase family protein [Longimicrobiales bacterium]|nr:TlpA disulfide reductase family protein [Longimicrobiales bacterium]